MAEHGKVNEKDLDGLGKLKELKHYQANQMIVIQAGEIPAISRVLSHKTLRTSDSKKIADGMYSWTYCESNLKSWFDEVKLVKKGKYSSKTWKNTENDEDVGKNTPKYIGGYNNLTKRKHNTWNSIKKTILENLKLTDDIGMACEDLNNRSQGYGYKHYFPYTDFTNKDINEILSIRPAAYSHGIDINGEQKTDWLRWSSVQIDRIMQGIMKYESVLHSLWVAIKYRQLNPHIRSLFKGKVYRRPVYLIDYPLKSKQSQSVYNNKHNAWPREIWPTLEEFKKSAYGKDSFVENISNAGVCITRNSIRNVSNKWRDDIYYQRQVRDFEINPAITLEDLEAEMYEFKARYNRLQKYRIELQRTREYIIALGSRNLDRKTKMVNGQLSSSMKTYTDEMRKLKEKENGLIKFEAYKMLKGKSSGVDMSFDLTQLDSDNDFSQWREMLHDANIFDFSEVGKLDSLDVVVISKAEYNRLVNMEMKL